MDLNVKLLLAAVVLFLFVLIFFRRQDKKQREESRKKLASEFGLKKTRVISEDYLSLLAEEEKEAEIDAITWNDLDMNALFMRLDHTSSFAGQEYFYHVLRNPRKPSGILERQIRDTAFYENLYAVSREDVLSLKEVLGILIKKEKVPFRSRFKKLSEAGPGERKKYKGAALFALFSIVMLFVFPAIGVVLTFAALVRNALIHSAAFEKTEQHIGACADALMLMAVSRELKKNPERMPEGFAETLTDNLSGLERFEKKGRLLTGTFGSVNGAAGSLLSYVNMFFLLDLLAYCDLQAILQEESERILRLWELLGYLDLVTSIPSMRASLPRTAVPVFATSGKESSGDCGVSSEEAGKESSKNSRVPLKETGSSDRAVFQAVDLYHPLLDHPVTNSVTLSKNLLLTGSNASGKSTFLKTVALNAIFARSLGFVCGADIVLSDFRVVSSMALRDQILSRDSYFMAEIKSLKRIVDADRQPGPLLAVIDEVLRGTNTSERIAASTEILRSLNRPGTLVLAATHDLELTRLLEKDYRNAHFEEVIGEHDIIFPYKLKEGPACGRNALALLKAAGFDEEAIRRAQRKAAYYDETGIWEAE